MSWRFLPLLCLVACGPSVKQARRVPEPLEDVEPPAEEHGAAPAASDPLPGACASLVRERRAGCPSLRGIPASISQAQCEQELEELRAGGGQLAADVNEALACMAQAGDCDAFTRCFGLLGRAAQANAQYRRCGEPGLGPVRLTEEEAAARTGARARRFSDVRTSRERPVEVCGVEAQHQWLLRATCDDGSHPFRSEPEAAAARAGNVGSGGRCDGTIDLYEVPCPERTYEVFMDLYMCAPGESF